MENTSVLFGHNRQKWAVYLGHKQRTTTRHVMMYDDV